MVEVCYSSPFVPAEWIAAHGLRPRRLFPTACSAGFQPARDRRDACPTGQGVCPYAQAFIEEAADAAAVVMVTTCDQMRRAAEVLSKRLGDHSAVFLLNVPATWQSDTAWKMFQAEIQRLGCFLVALGGVEPTREKLTDTLLFYDSLRAQLRRSRANLSPSAFLQAVVRYYSEQPEGEKGRKGEGETAAHAPDNIRTSSLPFSPSPPLPFSLSPPLPFSPSALPPFSPSAGRLALLGAPLLRNEWVLYRFLEDAGAQVVLDATETGERALPRPFDPARLRQSPLEEMQRAYFELPDAFRRPNDRLYAWLKDELARTQAEGLVLISGVWCDLWRAEAARVKATFGLPLLELDLSGAAQELPARAQTRLQAFLEMLA